MGCGSCSSTGTCVPAGCKSNGSCGTTGCQTLEVHDWLCNIDMPANYRPFNIIEVKFKGSRKEFFINTPDVYLEPGELVTVEGATSGYDVGHVSLTGELVRIQMKHKKTQLKQVTKKVLRKATEADVAKFNTAKEAEWETMHRARKLALELGLSMKISDVDYQADRSKATFYYTADDRVDFRELIKRMADHFRIRIEMRQIGMRQEAARLGGIGSCGRELCCSTWLTHFKTVSTAAARYQNLAINTSKLAGQCGKLKCCLNYELDSYIDALRNIPVKVYELHTEAGTARHQKTDIFKKLLWFSYPNDDTWIALDIARVKEIMQMNKAGHKPPHLKDLSIPEAEHEPAELSTDYENVVGQDSLTRLDDKERRSRRNNRPNERGDNRRDRQGSAGGTQRARPQRNNGPEAPGNDTSEGTGNAEGKSPRGNAEGRDRGNNNRNRQRARGGSEGGMRRDDNSNRERRAEDRTERTERGERKAEGDAGNREQDAEGNAPRSFTKRNNEGGAERSSRRNNDNRRRGERGAEGNTARSFTKRTDQGNGDNSMRPGPERPRPDGDKDGRPEA